MDLLASQWIFTSVDCYMTNGDVGLGQGNKV
jgi:hypothetical protein